MLGHVFPEQFSLWFTESSHPTYSNLFFSSGKWLSTVYSLSLSHLLLFLLQKLLFYVSSRFPLFSFKMSFPLHLGFLGWPASFTGFSTAPFLASLPTLKSPQCLQQWLSNCLLDFWLDFFFKEMYLFFLRIFKYSFSSQTSWVQILVHPLTSYINFGKLLSLSVPSFPYL